MECIICFEKISIMSIAECNHKEICFKCIIKCRIKLHNNKCPICKTEQKEVILSKFDRDFNKINVSEIKIYQEGILYIEEEIKKELD